MKDTLKIASIICQPIHPIELHSLMEHQQTKTFVSYLILLMLLIAKGRNDPSNILS